MAIPESGCYMNVNNDDSHTSQGDEQVSNESTNATMVPESECYMNDDDDDVIHTPEEDEQVPMMAPESGYMNDDADESRTPEGDEEDEQVADVLTNAMNEDDDASRTPEEEKQVFDQLTKDAEDNKKEGNLYYVLSDRWYKDWQRYTGHDYYVKDCDGIRPGPIDNFHLIPDHGSDDETDDDFQDMRELLFEGSDYVLVPEQVWNKLHSWYKGGPAIPRKLINQGFYSVEVYPLTLKLIDSRDGKKFTIRMSKKDSVDALYHKVCSLLDLEPGKVKIWDYYNQSKHGLLPYASDGSLEETLLQMNQYILLEVQNELASVPIDPPSLSISIAGGPAVSNSNWKPTSFHTSSFGMESTGGELAASVAIDPPPSPLITIFDDPEFDDPAVSSSSFHTSGFRMESTENNKLAIVASYPPSSSSSSISTFGKTFGMGSGSSSNRYSLFKGIGLGSILSSEKDGDDMIMGSMKKSGGGLIGLENLGNTCFMNSALQCLLHTPSLVEYFLQDYSEEINTQNPLGLQGKLAVVFGKLLRKTWSSGRGSIAPREFKATLGKFAAQFSGYSQHDSQELLAFLLDGLHEDLNRVKNKPYIEAKDTDGWPDSKVAKECWENHKARNDSVIVDVCQGQYKSTLVCPTCSKISVTFDPFMYLSVPLPTTVTRSMTVTVFHGDGSALPMTFTVSVLKHGSVKDLIQALGYGPDGCCLRSDERLVLAEVFSNKIYRYLDNPYLQLIDIKDDDRLVAYRVPKVPVEESTKLEILFRSKPPKLSSTYYGKGKSIIGRMLPYYGGCRPDISYGGDSKPYGTPLVTCFSDGLLTGADLQPLVHKMLMPFLRTTSASPPNQAMELDDETLNGDSSSFHLCLVNKMGTRRDIVKEQVFEHGKTISVLLEWSDRERELYDVSSYIEDLPKVNKSTWCNVKKFKHEEEETVSLFSCLEAFLKEEPLGPDDMWYCPTCKEHKEATKKLDLWRLPEVLVFHLKRFSYNRWMKNKLDTLVDFPIRKLDLSQYVRSEDDTQSHIYELYAISNHYGGLGGGHYTAYAKVEGDNWHHFNDSSVSPASEDRIKTSAAYVLFYRRVEAEREGGASNS